jgi:archaellum biogenesis protein FlaJ (TadC family)
MATADRLNALDRGLYALFSRHADRRRHERDRDRYRAAALRTDFDVYLARVYGLSWLGFAVGGLCAAGLALFFPGSLLDALGGFLSSGLPLVNRLDLPRVPRGVAAVGLGLVAGYATKRGAIGAGSQYLRWAADARRSDIERTLPGAVRYLRALAAGSDRGTTLVRKVAEQDAYGETAVAFRTALNRARLTGSLDEGLRMVARDTPSREMLAPFLLKFREHANQGGDALADYLRMESRMLSHRQDRARQRAADFLELLAELFVVLLVLPALLVIVVTVMAVLSPALDAPIQTPLGETTLRTVVVYGSAVFVVVIGATTAGIIDELRPTGQSPPSYDLPEAPLAVLASAPTNPASALVVAAPLGVAVAGLSVSAGYHPLNVALLGYVGFSLPVGAVAVRRARRDAAKDRQMRDFVHSVAGHVSLGRPFAEAVDRVASEVDFGALQSDVDDLAFDLSMLTTADGAGDVRAEALERFVDRVGTRLAAQTVGLVQGALDAGSDAEAVFETLQTEIGRLHSQKRALRSQMLVYVAVGWTTALLVVGIVIAVNAYVLDGFAQLSAVPADSTVVLNSDAVQPARDRFRFYVVAQATVLACGWFAGTASRGYYEALLHSGLLVALTYVVFAGVGML